MRGIINSELNPEELIVIDPKTNKVDHSKLLGSLKEKDYLIGLFQKMFFDLHTFNVESEVWENVTPVEYTKVMKEAMNKLDCDLAEAYWRASSKIHELAVKCKKEALKRDAESQ